MRINSINSVYGNYSQAKSCYKNHPTFNAQLKIDSDLKNSMNGGDEFTPLPSTEDLILDGKNDNELSSKFEQLQENGRAFLKTVCDYARKQVKKMMPADGGRGYRHSVERF